VVKLGEVEERGCCRGPFPLTIDNQNQRSPRRLFPTAAVDLGLMMQRVIGAVHNYDYYYAKDMD
jgi:hypothetical protein